MNPDNLRAFGIIAGIVASPAVILAMIKAVIFFGRMEKTVEGLTEELKEFRRDIRDSLDQVKADVEMIKAERRLEDRGRSARGH